VDKYPGVPFETLATAAARLGDLPMLCKFRGCTSGLPASVFYAAIEGGNMKMLKYLHESHSFWCANTFRYVTLMTFCKFGTQSGPNQCVPFALRVAEEAGNPEVIAFLRENNY
jgi:hypothetical protein